MNLLDLTGERAQVLRDQVGGQLGHAGGVTPTEVCLGLRPEDIEIHEGVGTPAELVTADYLGADTIVTAQMAGQSIRVRHAGRFTLEPGRQVYLRWPLKAVHLFDKETGRSLAQTRSRASAGEAVNSD